MAEARERGRKAGGPAHTRRSGSLCHSNKSQRHEHRRTAGAGRGPEQPGAPEVLCAAPRNKSPIRLPAQQGRPVAPSGAGTSQRPQRVAMAPPRERRLVECEGGASFKPTLGGASPVWTPAQRRQPLGSRAGPPRPRSHVSPRLAPPAPEPLSLAGSTAFPRFPRALSQDSARLATAPVPRSPCACPRPQPVSFLRSRLHLSSRVSVVQVSSNLRSYGGP